MLYDHSATRPTGVTTVTSLIEYITLCARARTALRVWSAVIALSLGHSPSPRFISPFANSSKSMISPN